MRATSPLLIIGWAVFAMLGFTLKYGAVCVIQSTVFLGCLLYCLRYVEFRSLLTALNPLQLLAIGGLLGLILVGQITGNDRRTYPFLEWAMYCSPHPESEFYEYRVELASGETRPYPFIEITPTRSNRHITDRIDKMVDNALRTKSPAALDNLRSVLGKWAELYHLRHPKTPLRAITVERKTVRIDGLSPSAERVETLPVLRVEFDQP
jgi:hypothetical protein